MLITLFTKTKVLNVVALLVLLQCVMPSIVSSNKLTCKAGEGPGPLFVASGDGSQCSGIFKITTEAECKAAAEYNRKNNIDTNKGYGGSKSYSSWPSGCMYHSQMKKYSENYKSYKTKISCCRITWI